MWDRISTYLSQLIKKQALSLFKKNESQPKDQKKVKELVSIPWTYVHGMNEITIFPDGGVLVKYPHNKSRRFGSLAEYLAMTID